MSFGSISQPARPIKVTLDDAKIAYKYEVDCHVWRFVAADDANQVIRVKFNESTSEWIDCYVGMGYSHFPIKTFWVSHEANVGKSAFIQVAGNSALADLSKFEVFASESAGNVLVSNTDAEPVPIQAVGGGNLPVEPGPVDLTESATWVAIDEETTSETAEQVYQCPTGRRLDITGGVIVGDGGAVVEVRDSDGEKRWLDVACTQTRKVPPMSLTAGMKIYQRTIDAAETARIMLAAKIVNLDGSEGYVNLTSDSSEVPTGGATNRAIFIAAASMPAQMLASIRADGGDVRAWSGSTQLPCVALVVTGVCVGWYVRFPSFSDSVDDVYKLTFDGVSKAEAVDSTYGRNAVFAGREGVYPLIYDPTGDATFPDWSGSGNDGASTGTMTDDDLVSTDMPLGYGIDFDATDDNIVLPSSLINNQTELLFRIRFRFDTLLNGAKERTVFYDTAPDKFALYSDGDVYINGTKVGTLSILAGVDYDLVLSLDGVNIVAVLDGVQAFSTAFTGGVGGSDSTLIGGENENINFYRFDGVIDFVEVGYTAESLADIQTTYKAENDPDSFWTIEYL